MIGTNLTPVMRRFWGKLVRQEPPMPMHHGELAAPSRRMTATVSEAACAGGNNAISILALQVRPSECSSLAGVFSTRDQRARWLQAVIDYGLPS